MFKQAALGLAFVSVPLVLSSILLQSEHASDGLNAQVPPSDQQLEWEQMLVGESAEAVHAASQGYSWRGDGVPDGVPFTIRGKPAPDDFVDAQCIDMHDVRESCKLKVDRTNQAIGV